MTGMAVLLLVQQLSAIMTGLHRAAVRHDDVAGAPSISEQVEL
jgi:hypothetical protein